MARHEEATGANPGIGLAPEDIFIMRQKWLVALVYTIGVLSVWAGAGTQPRKNISFTNTTVPL